VSNIPRDNRGVSVIFSRSWTTIVYPLRMSMGIRAIRMMRVIRAMITVGVAIAI
jgi:hypothetical protein